MRYFLIFCLALLLSLNSYAQDKVSVEKSIFNIQAGLIGGYFNNELKIFNPLALRTEVGISVGFFSNSLIENFGTIIAPSLSIEPRWYYNLNSRSKNGKTTKGNSANFFTIKGTYVPALPIYNSEDNIELVSSLAFIPTWGMRRDIGMNLNYEFGFGIGYQETFADDNVFIINDSDIAVNLHIRIGYQF